MLDSGIMGDMVSIEDVLFKISLDIMYEIEIIEEKNIHNTNISVPTRE